MKWIISSSKRKHYFQNILYQRAKFWHGLPPTDLISHWAGEELETLKADYKSWTQAHPHCSWRIYNMLFTSQIAETDNIWVSTDRHTSLYERIWRRMCKRIVQIKYLKFCISFLHRNMVLRLSVIIHNCVTATLLYQLHYVDAIFHINRVDRNVYCSPEAVEMFKLPNGAFILSTLLFDKPAIWFFLFSVCILYRPLVCIRA